MAKRKKIDEEAQEVLDRLSGQRTMSYTDLLELNNALGRLNRCVKEVGDVEDKTWNLQYGLEITVTVRDAQCFIRLAKAVKKMLE